MSKMQLHRYQIYLISEVAKMDLNSMLKKIYKGGRREWTCFWENPDHDEKGRLVKTDPSLMCT